MAGERDATDFFCAFVRIDPGELTQQSIHVEEKRVTGWKSYGLGPHLAQIAENKVWASFHNSDEIWIGELKGEEVVMTKHSDHLPTEEGFGAPPLRLPDGRLLAAGGWPSSADITLITPGERFSFEKIGDIPGEGRYCVSTTLIKERFVVGFGGWVGVHMDEMWIFDLQTKKASPVAREGDWHPVVSWPFLTIKDDILYIVGGQKTQSVHSITFQNVSDLIQELDFQPIFQRALGLKPRRYPADRTDNGEFRGMCDLGGCFPGYLSYNTIDRQGRVFHFSQCQRKLCVTEILIGRWVKTKTVDTGIDCKTDDDNHISCCSLGDNILVMAGEKNTSDCFCAIVSMDPGVLSGETIHVEEKRVTGWGRYEEVSFLAQISENKVWISFDSPNEIWIGELKGDKLVMTKHPDHLPIKYGFCVPPLRLPDGRFLVAGGDPYSRAITLITPGEQFSFEKVGEMPGEERCGVSTILIGERFLVGFGGSDDKNDMDNMWIFDLQTRKVSPVTKEGEWHLGGPWPVLVVRDKELYVIGGWKTTTAHSLSFATLVRLIQNRRVRCAFCSCLGLQFWFGASLHRSTVMYYAPQWL